MILLSPALLCSADQLLLPVLGFFIGSSAVTRTSLSLSLSLAAFVICSIAKLDPSSLPLRRCIFMFLHILDHQPFSSSSAFFIWLLCDFFIFILDHPFHRKMLAWSFPSKNVEHRMTGRLKLCSLSMRPNFFRLLSILLFILVWKLVFNVVFLIGSFLSTTVFLLPVRLK